MSTKNQVTTVVKQSMEYVGKARDLGRSLVAILIALCDLDDIVEYVAGITGALRKKYGEPKMNSKGASGETTPLERNGWGHVGITTRGIYRVYRFAEAIKKLDASYVLDGLTEEWQIGIIEHAVGTPPRKWGDKARPTVAEGVYRLEQILKFAKASVEMTERGCTDAQSVYDALGPRAKMVIFNGVSGYVAPANGGDGKIYIKAIIARLETVMGKYVIDKDHIAYPKIQLLIQWLLDPEVNPDHIGHEVARFVKEIGARTLTDAELTEEPQAVDERRTVGGIEDDATEADRAATLAEA